MMNEQSSKKISFNKSTLVSLKAELLRKQAEVRDKKQLPQHQLENFKPAPSKSSETNETADKVSFKDKLRATDVEELEAQRKAKAALERKAELYEHLADGAGDSQLAGRFLVDFKNKKEALPPRVPSPQPPESSTEDCLDDEEEWIEFTDCLGRTRKCHKNDIELYRKRDVHLMQSMIKESGDGAVADDNAVSEKPAKEMPLLVQKTNDYLHSLRDKWDQKERELLEKDKDIHYQDLLFDEARMHGVGYYSFSTDETERRKQMAELNKLRAETLKAQKVAEEAKRKRDELMAARVAAAKARRRMRAGLPPEDPEEKKQQFTEALLQFLTQQRDEADAKVKEEERIKKEALEKERQKIREGYVRDWDIGKDGVEDPKKFREMTQEEYEEQQRSKRIDEFAPPQQPTTSRSRYAFDEKGHKTLDTPSTSYNTDTLKTWTDVRPKAKTPPPLNISDITDSKGLYFSSTKNKATELKYKNFVKQDPVPIVNELDEDEDRKEFEERQSFKRKGEAGTEIAPPPTYDYYGPVPKHSKVKKPFDSDIREAYDQGVKSLKTKESKRHISDQYDFIL